jgi:hypothetical protein
MKLTMLVLCAASLSLAGPASADNYDILAAKGYRWVTIHGPYASTTEQGVQRITDHRDGPTESQILEDDEAYYLIPGKIVQLIKEDPTSGMSRLQLGGFATFLWTYSRFLSKHPIRDVYGVIETPENSGLVPSVATVITPNVPDQATARTRENRN